MSAPDTVVAARIDELLRRSSLRLEQQRIHVAALTGRQALLAGGDVGLHRPATKYRAKLA